MQELIERIRSEGVNLGGGILKVDSLINHQLDPQLMLGMGTAIAERFAGVPIDRILTAEISGIAPALMVGIELGIPVVYARKKKPITMAGPVYLETAPSHTKGGETLLLVSAEFLRAGENVLIIDDFLASGQTLLALARIVKSARANLVGVGVVVEKTFENGRAAVQAQFDVPIHALATITAMEGAAISLLDTRQTRLELD
ncbi:MAG: xanthine phosphoribosyltransferase [Chloroflexi bacterium]|nr:xanthine phosphoribosyltransferase [Chloroflexota bacterium]MXX84701.1 xanthine phosphoribosyltransferase [Chloroflexota bacterium]